MIENTTTHTHTQIERYQSGPFLWVLFPHSTITMAINNPICPRIRQYIPTYWCPLDRLSHNGPAITKSSIFQTETTSEPQRPKQKRGTGRTKPETGSHGTWYRRMDGSGVTVGGNLPAGFRSIKKKKGKCRRKDAIRYNNSELASYTCYA